MARIKIIKFLKPSGWKQFLRWFIGGILLGLLATGIEYLMHSLGVQVWSTSITTQRFATASISVSIAVVAIAVPTALNIVSHVYEKYTSNHVTGVLLESLPLKVLTIAAFGNLIISIMLAAGLYISPIFAWLCLISLLIVLWLFFRFMDAIIPFVLREPQKAIEYLNNQIELQMKPPIESLNSNKDYLAGVEGLGDILNYLAKNSTSSITIKEILGGMAVSIDKLLVIKNKNRGHYEEVVLTTNIQQEDRVKKDKMLLFFPDELFSGLMITTNEVIRCFQTAAINNNDTVAGMITEWLIERARTAIKLSLSVEPSVFLKQFRIMLAKSQVLHSSPQIQSLVGYEWLFSFLFSKSTDIKCPEKIVVSVIEDAFECLKLVVDSSPRDVWLGYCSYAADWSTTVDVTAGSVNYIKYLDDLTFAVASYALASGKSDYVKQLLDYGQRAAEADTFIGRNTLPVSINELLLSWNTRWSLHGSLDRFSGIAPALGAKRKLFVLLLARSIIRNESAASPYDLIKITPIKDLELMERAIDEVLEEIEVNASYAILVCPNVLTTQQILHDIKKTFIKNVEKTKSNKKTNKKDDKNNSAQFLPRPNIGC